MRRILKIVVLGLLTVQTSKAQKPAPGFPETERVIPSLDGQTLYATYCAVCHGVRADGGGPMSAALRAKAPDLTRIAARNGGVFPSVRVQKIIDGGEAVLSHGTREMPVWGPIFSSDLSDRDYGKLRTYNVTNYLASLQKR